MRTRPDSGVCRCGSVSHSPNRPLFRNAIVAFLFLVALAGVAQDGRPVPNTAQATPNAATQPAADSAKPTLEQKAVPADERTQQITSDSSRLLTMAIALKVEVDKTNKDTLSLNVIRKADEIEKLARTVKEKIKQSAGPG